MTANQQVAQWHDAQSIRLTLTLMQQGEYLRALESAQLRLVGSCWINSDEIGEA